MKMLWLTGALFLACVPRASADRRIYVLSIGNNALPAHNGDPELRPLRFADDDAAAFANFMKPFAVRTTLLSVLDADSQRRFGMLAQTARVPSHRELSATVNQYRQQMLRDREEGHDPELFFFFSGHGERPSGAPASLALLDGGITRPWLYDDLLSRLPARYVHLFVDACHAEAVIQPRDASAEIVDLNSTDIRAWTDQHTLRRFPHVGAVIATAADQVAHEWDVYQHGVFTHQVLSGLRGAADVNQDHRIEYSELHAFIAAANRDVRDTRARLAVLVHAPALNRRAALLELRTAGTYAWLKGDASRLGHFEIEDEFGRRWMDARFEPGHGAALLIPSRTTVFVRSGSKETILRSATDAEVTFASLRFANITERVRGSVVSALRAGLFASAYGLSYYRGFVDRQDEVPVEMSPSRSQTILASESASSDRPSPLPAYILWSSAGALVLASSVFGILMADAHSDWEQTELQRQAAEVRDRYNDMRLGLFITAGAALVAGTAGLLLYPWSSESSRRPAVRIHTTVGGLALSFRQHF